MGNRFLAIDVMRGLTLALMIVVNLQIGEGKSYAQLLHAPWDGVTLTDLVFPTFMFVVGTSLSFTLDKYELPCTRPAAFWPTGFIRRREAGARFENCLLGIPRKEVVAGARYANYLKVDLV